VLGSKEKIMFAVLKSVGDEKKIPSLSRNPLGDCSHFGVIEREKDDLKQLSQQGEERKI